MNKIPNASSLISQVMMRSLHTLDFQQHARFTKRCATLTTNDNTFKMLCKVAKMHWFWYHKILHIITVIPAYFSQFSTWTAGVGLIKIILFSKELKKKLRHVWFRFFMPVMSKYLYMCPIVSSSTSKNACNIFLYSWFK